MAKHNDLGKAGENAAAAYLEKEDYLIRHRTHSARQSVGSSSSSSNRSYYRSERINVNESFCQDKKLLS